MQDDKNAGLIGRLHKAPDHEFAYTHGFSLSALEKLELNQKYHIYRATQGALQMCIDRRLFCEIDSLSSLNQLKFVCKP